MDGINERDHKADASAQASSVPAASRPYSAEEIFTVDFVKENNVVPSHIDNSFFFVYTNNPNDIYIQQQLEILSGLQIVFIEETNSAFEKRVGGYQNNVDQLEGLSEEFKFQLIIDDGESETYEDFQAKGETDGPIVKLINTIIASALSKRVSDIHIECHEASVAVKYRIDGVLYPATVDLDIAFHSSLVSRFKVMAELDIAEKRVPQDGRFKLRVGKKGIDFRMSVIPSLYGENIVVRILDNYLAQEDSKAPSLESMGFNETQLNIFSRAINEPHGMVLVTGPTGSGKTTTLYAALDSINSGEHKIITIEDPVEYQLGGIMQIPVNLKKGLSFAKALRSVLRHDPDKILVGEIRDLETVEIAVQSALTGHLVFSSVHANSAIDVFARLQNMGVNLYNCLSALNCIVSQRLVRVNCKYCAQEKTYSASDLKSFGLNSSEIALVGSMKIIQGVGCEHCSNTGYSGRQMIAEVLVISDELREAVLDDVSIKELIKRANLVDGITLRDAAVALMQEGSVSLEEVNRVTFHK